MSDNLYLFANNNGGQAEGNGSYRLYDMKIEGDSEGAESGVNYVDYLEGDRASWIDTGIVGNNKYKYELVFMDTTATSYENYFGVYNNSTKANLSIQRMSNDLGFNVNYDKLYKWVEGATIGDKMTIYVDANKIYKNGTLIQTMTEPTETISYGVSTYLFDRNPHDVYSDMKCYSFKTWNENNALVQDLRPCLDTEGVPCMYDEVSKKYLYNKGTGTFKYKKTIRDFQPVLDSNNIPCLLDKIKNKFYYNKSGEVFKTKEKPKYKKLKYLIGDGDNYIDLGQRTVDSNTKIKTKVENVDGNQCCVFQFDNSNNFKYLLSESRHMIYYNGNWISLDEKLEQEFNLNEYGFTYNGVIYLFKISSANTDYAGKSKIYYFQMYQSDQLTLDLIPVLDQNNIPCMYDKVSDQFFYNQGTGTFGYEIEELKGECYEVACTTEDIVNNINPLLTNVKFKVLDNKTISMPESARWTPLQFDGKSDKGLKLKAYTKYTIIVKPISTYTSHGSICNVCVTDKKRYTLNLDKPTIVETGYKGEFLLYPHISESPVEKIGIIVLEGEHPDAIYSSFDNIQVSIHAEYIESNGTQYIDTGVVPNSNTDIDMTCRACDYSDYVSDGLILNLDGINNTRRGHKSDTTVWEDLSGNGIDFDLHNVTINNDNMYFTGDKTSADVYSYASIQNIEDWVNICNGVENYTVEICIQCGTEGEFYQPIISQKPAKADVAMSVGRFVLNNTTNGLDYPVKFCPNINTLSFNMNTYESFINNEVQDLSTSGSSEIDPPTNNNFWIGARLEGSYYCFTGKIYSIRIYNRHLADTERLYNHSVDVKKFGVTTEVQTCNIGKYILNNLSYMNDEYNYNNIDTTVQPNLVASEGATLTMGSTNLALLDDEDIETATNNGWNLV